jgi:hypothetical protein
MLSRIFNYAANASIAFLVTLVVLAVMCGSGCGGEESCFGPVGSFEGDGHLSIFNCSGIAPSLPPSMKLAVERDSFLRACGWHRIATKTVLRPDGCAEEWREDLNTKADGYRKIVIVEVSCPAIDAKCGAVWEIDYEEVPK